MLTFIWDDGGESCDIKYNGAYVGNINHDEDGWAGMTKTRDCLVTLANLTGVRVKDIGDPCV